MYLLVSKVRRLIHFPNYTPELVSSRAGANIHNLWGKLRGWGVFMGVSGCLCAAAMLMSLALERRWRGARSLE